MNAEILKLVTGENIIAEVLSESDTELQIQNPFQLALSESLKYVMMPGWMPLVEKEEGNMIVTLEKHNIVGRGKADANTTDVYREETTGLSIPPKPGLVLPQ